MERARSSTFLASTWTELSPAPLSKAALVWQRQRWWWVRKNETHHGHVPPSTVPLSCHTLLPNHGAYTDAVWYAMAVRLVCTEEGQIIAEAWNLINTQMSRFLTQPAVLYSKGFPDKGTCISCTLPLTPLTWAASWVSCVFGWQDRTEHRVWPLQTACLGPP